MYAPLPPFKKIGLGSAFVLEVVMLMKGKSLGTETPLGIVLARRWRCEPLLAISGDRAELVSWLGRDTVAVACEFACVRSILRRVVGKVSNPAVPGAEFWEDLWAAGSFFTEAIDGP